MMMMNITKEEAYIARMHIREKIQNTDRERSESSDESVTIDATNTTQLENNDSLSAMKRRDKAMKNRLLREKMKEIQMFAETIHNLRLSEINDTILNTLQTQTQ
jgi:hypothetical protein